MKKESQPYNQLSDGSRYYGNGVWGPSTLDLQRADLISANEEPKTKEEPNPHLLFVSQESVVGRLLQTISKVKLPAKFAIPSSMATVFLMSACGGGGEKNTQELENKESSDYALPFPPGETWFLTGGPHADGLSNGVRYAIDIAPPEVGKCPTDGSKLVIDTRIVTASASGQVIVADDDKNRSDPSHSMVKVEDKKGLTQVYIHLANTKVKKGDNVKQGAPLGNPSCEYPPGGRNEGTHVHVGLEKDGQAIPIDGVVVGGWTIHNEPKNYDGTMTKNGEKTRTADTRRCPDDKACGGIRNDLTSEPIRQVLGQSTGPTPTAKLIETKKPTQAGVEKQPEQGWTRFRSLNYPYEIDVPPGWTIGNMQLGGNILDVFQGETVGDFQTNVSILSEPVKSWVRVEDYAKNYLDTVRKISPDAVSTIESDPASIKEIERSLEYLKSKQAEEDEILYKQKTVYKTIQLLETTKVAGQKTYIIYASVSKNAIFFNPPYATVTAIYLKNEQAWQIALSSSPVPFVDPRLTNEYTIKVYEEFQKMLSSFKFLK